MSLSRVFKIFLKDERAVPLGIKLVTLVIFARALGWGFADPLFPLYLQQFGGKYSLIGSMVSLLSLGSILTIFPLMRLTDHVREGVIIRDGEVVYFLAIVSYILAGIFGNLWLLLAALFLTGVGQSLIVVGAESYIRKNDGGGGKATPFGLYLALDNFGWVLGMIIGAFTIQYYGLNWMFAAVIPSIILSFFVLPHLRETGLSSFARGLKKYFHRKKDFTRILHDIHTLNPKMIFFLILAFFDGVIRIFSFVFIPLIGYAMDLSLSSISLLMAALYFPFIFSFFFSEIEDRMPRMNVIAVGLFLGALSYLFLFWIVHQAWMILLIVMTSFSIAIIRPAYNSAITRLTPRHMLGEITGLHNLVERLGRILGPIFMGFVADFYGLKTAFLVVAVLAFSLGIVSLFLRGYNSLVGISETENGKHLIHEAH